MGKFTFKTDKPTGRYAWTHKPIHKIKFNKKEVGVIEHESPHKIRLMVMKTDTITDNNPNCDWKWIVLKRKSNSVDEAKTFLNKIILPLMIKYEFKTD